MEDGCAILAQPRLPTDVAAWESDLGGKKITAEDIAEAVSQFEVRNMKCCDSYLNWYLALDVLILFKACIGNLLTFV